MASVVMTFGRRQLLRLIGVKFVDVDERLSRMTVPARYRAQVERLVNSVKHAGWRKGRPVTIERLFTDGNRVVRITSADDAHVVEIMVVPDAR